MAFFHTGFLASLVFFAGPQNAASFELPGHPNFPIASFNGSLVASATSRANGSFTFGGASCTDAFGAFPCSCLALSFPQEIDIRTTSAAVGYITEPQYNVGTGPDESITGSTIVTYGGKEVQTESIFTIPSPPDDCCESCEIDSSRVHIIFWPVDNNNNTAQNVSNASVAAPYTMVSDGFTFTSPSVYVAYDNLQASTECFRLGYGYSAMGKAYNTTIAYNPEDLSTSQCFYGHYKPINYTELQYPPPNSLLTDCYHPGGEYATSHPSDLSIPSSSPILSYPPGINELVPSWKACTVSQLGAYDPPKTLSKATAMVPVPSSPILAAPASSILPPHATATPAPTPQNPQKDPLNSATPLADPADPGSSPGLKADPVHGSQQGPADPSPSPTPKANHGPGSQQNSQQSRPQNINNPLGGNNPSSSNPSNNDQSNNDPSSNGKPGNNYSPVDNPSKNASPINGQPTGNNPPSNQNPSSHDPQRNNEMPKNDPTINDPNSVLANPVPASPQTNSQPQGFKGQSPPSAATDGANSIETPGLGAQIASAFGYVPGSTAVPETHTANSPVFATGAPNLGPTNAEIIANGSPTQLTVGGSPVEKASKGAIVVAGQTVPQGSQATIFGVVVSVGSNNVAIDSTMHFFSPLAAETPTSLIVGGYTGQRGPDGSLVVAGQTITLGAQATVAGVVVSVGSDNAILDRSTYNRAPVAPAPLSIIVGGVTTALQPGVAGVSRAPIINIAGQELSFSQASPYTNAASQALSLGTSGQGSPYIIAGQTLTPGGAAVTISGVPISIPAGQSLAANSPAKAIAESAIRPEGPAPLTIGDQVFTPNPSAFVVAGTTVSAGGPGVTVAGTVVSLLQSGSSLVIGSSTLSVPLHAGASLSSSGGSSANPTSIVGSMTSSRVTSTGTTSSVQTSSDDTVRPSSARQSAQRTSSASSGACAGRQQGSSYLGLVASLVVGEILRQRLL